MVELSLDIFRWISYSIREGGREEATSRLRKHEKIKKERYGSVGAWHFSCIEYNDIIRWGDEMDMTLVYCVFVDDELARVFSNEDKAQEYLERLYDDGVDGYYIGIILDWK